MHDRQRKTVDGRTWIRLCKSEEVNSRQGKRIEYDIEHDLALFRVDGTVHVVSNICPHKRGAELYDGVVAQGCITCPLHGWVFNLTTGKPLIGAGQLKVYECMEHLGGVWIAEESLEVTALF